MGAYKQFLSQDIIVSPLEVNKSFTFKGGELTGSNVGIDFYIGKPGDFLISQSESGDINPIPEVLIYNSIKQLYYSNYTSGSYGEISEASTASFNIDGTIEGSPYQTNYYNYNQTTLNPQKTLSGSLMGVYSIPSKLYGDYIQPHSFISKISETNFIQDDGNGRIISSSNEFVGNIIYEHGIVVLGNFPSASIDSFTDNNSVTCSFSSSYEIFETQYKVTIGSDEFTYSQNPTLLSGSTGQVYDYVTGSYFSPYISCVGLYNEYNDLLAVAKLAQPLPTSKYTDTTILINIDR